MAEARTQSNRRWLWIGLAIVLIGVFFTARYFLRDRLPVRLATVGYATVTIPASTNGRVEPIENHQFFSPLATTVRATYVREGDVVHPGKLLLVLDDTEARARVASAESGVKAAQAALDAARNNGTQAERQASASEIAQNILAVDQAQHDVEALSKLAANGAASQGELAAAQSRMQTAQASLNAAEQTGKSRYSSAEIARAEAGLADAQAALDAAKHVEGQTTIYAPITGTVYTLDAFPSSYAEPGKLLLQIADLNREQVRAYFDEPDLGRLAVGQSVAVRWEAKPGSEWHGHITRLPSTIVTYTTRNVGEVLVDLDGSEDGLLPDTNVTVTVTISSQANALNMPREALHEQNGKYFVFKVNDNELTRTPVTIGTPNLTQVPILSGLKSGDAVATGTTNGQPLQEGIPIKVVP